jgi:hypothetical protein
VNPAAALSVLLSDNTMKEDEMERVGKLRASVMVAIAIAAA